MEKKIPCQGKHREFGNFAKTQGIWFAQVINSLILKVKDLSIFAVKISKKKIKAGYVCQVSFVYVIVTNNVNWHRENLRLDREFENVIEWVPCYIYLNTCQVKFCKM